MAWRGLNVYGYDASTEYQSTFANYPLKYLITTLGCRRRSRLHILRDFEGLVYGGEMLLVLGKPGSGCTTFLKTLAGRTYGLHLDDSALLNYQGKHALALYAWIPTLF